MKAESFTGVKEENKTNPPRGTQVSAPWFMEMKGFRSGKLEWRGRLDCRYEDSVYSSVMQDHPMPARGRYLDGSEHSLAEPRLFLKYADSFHQLD